MKSKQPGRHVMPDGLLCLKGVSVQYSEQTTGSIVERQVNNMSLVELNSLFKEDTHNNPREKYLRSLMDMYVDPTEVAHTPENGYLKGRKVSEVDRFQIVKMVQNTALALASERPGILDSPRELIDALCEKGMSIKAIQFCLELPPRDIEGLKVGYRFPYYESAWKSVFGDLEQKVADRKFDNEEDLLQSTLFCVKNTHIKKLRELCRTAGRRFEEPEELLQYVADQGIPIPLLGRSLYMSYTSIKEVVDGIRPLSNSGIRRLNGAFGKHFPVSDVRRPGRRRTPLPTASQAAAD